MSADCTELCTFWPRGQPLPHLTLVLLASAAEFPQIHCFFLGIVSFCFKVTETDGFSLCLKLVFFNVLSATRDNVTTPKNSCLLKSCYHHPQLYFWAAEMKIGDLFPLRFLLNIYKKNKLCTPFHNKPFFLSLKKQTLPNNMLYSAIFIFPDIYRFIKDRVMFVYLFFLKQKSR